MAGVAIHGNDYVDVPDANVGSTNTQCKLVGTCPILKCIQSDLFLSIVMPTEIGMVYEEQVNMSNWHI